jgi:hypothetical protein
VGVSKAPPRDSSRCVRAFRFLFAGACVCNCEPALMGLFCSVDMRAARLFLLCINNMFAEDSRYHVG